VDIDCPVVEEALDEEVQVWGYLLLDHGEEDPSVPGVVEGSTDVKVEHEYSPLGLEGLLCFGDNSVKSSDRAPTWDEAMLRGGEDVVVSCKSSESSSNKSLKYLPYL